MIRHLARFSVALFFVAVGVRHFTDPELFVGIMPPYLPWHLELVYISGVFEILGGVGLLIPRLRRAAAWGLIALYVAVFPANIYMAVAGVQLDPANPLPSWVGWVRLPFQALFIYWAWLFTKPNNPEEE